MGGFTMKRLFVLVSLVMAALFITACGGGEKSDKKAANKPIVIYTASEEERIAYLQDNLKKKFPNQEIVLQSLGTGQLLSKLQAEGKNSSCDIFYDLEVTNAEIILNKNPDMFVDLSKYDLSIYDKSVTGYMSRHKRYAVNGKTCGAFLVNTKVLKDKGIPMPKSFNDLLKPEYKGLVAMPSPKSSGTGYSLYNGIVTTLGESKGMEYFKKLNTNIKEYTTSGSAPVKAVKRGDVALGFGLLWQCVNYANADNNLKVLVLDNKAPYNLFVMGMISGHEINPGVKEVFDYLFNDLNKTQVAKLNPDKIYTKQLPNEIKNYPVGFEEIYSDKIFDFKYKQSMLDKWEF